jgi:predicted small integral membrane protein
MPTTRLVKVVMVGSLALFALVVAFDNLVDYGSNYEFVRHTLSMDTTFPANALKGRAITEPAAWTIAYWLIILTEAAVGILLAFATLRLATTIRADARLFNSAKKFAVLGGGLGFLLWFTGFMVVGGEWFAMWQSKTWNGLDAATRVIVLTGVAMLVTNLPGAAPETD